MYRKGRISFSFIAEEWSRVCTHCSFFTHSPIVGYGSCFHVYNNVHSASMNMGCMYLFKLPFSFSWKAPKWKCLRFYFSFWGTCRVFPIVAAPIHVPASSALVFPLLHVLTNTACFLPFDRPSLTFAGHQPLWRCAAQPCGSWPSPAPACPAMLLQQVRSEGESSSPLVHLDPGQGQSRVLWSLTLTQGFGSLLRKKKKTKKQCHRIQYRHGSQTQNVTPRSLLRPWSVFSDWEQRTNKQRSCHISSQSVNSKHSWICEPGTVDGGQIHIS